MPVMKSAILSPYFTHRSANSGPQFTRECGPQSAFYPYPGGISHGGKVWKPLASPIAIGWVLVKRNTTEHTIINLNRSNKEHILQPVSECWCLREFQVVQLPQCLHIKCGNILKLIPHFIRWQNSASSRV